ncbi:MAG: transglutaminase domain-containing protein [Cytophagaceae bacterium]
MKSEDRFSIMRIIVSLIFLVLPTIGITWLMSAQTNAYLGYLSVNPWWQTLFFSAGMVAAFVLYSFRARFAVTAGLLAFLLYAGYKAIEKYYVGEFDSYFLSVQYALYAFVFILSWLMGYGLARLRYFPIGLAVFYLLFTIVLHTSSTLILDMKQYLLDFLPVVVYTFYIIYIREVIQSMQAFRWPNLFKLLGRTALFLLFLAVVLFASNYIFGNQIAELEDAVNESRSGNSKNQPNDKDDMMDRNSNGKDTTFNLKKYAELRSRLGRNQELLFCAHLENYFQGTDIPNPLYFASYYLTKYNPKTEVFELDPHMPVNDMFMPNPSVIPLYFTESDSNTIKNGRGDELRKTVEVDVYVRSLSPSDFTAPGTAFSCQPISVDEEFRQEFKSAYRAKSYISELNSAYFIYNTDQPQIKAFQERRFEVLREIDNYKKTDSTFMEYYTRIPKGPVFDSIAGLAHELTDKKKKPIDKILAIRDYFLSKDDQGRPLYKYTLTPGGNDSKNMRGVQTTTNLSRFLFKTHKGYCTYFAGASLYLLRSIGIPTRLTAGFMTVDRADKNPGWYWFYGDQAHAWIQVYFPEYGWIDFDTTIGAEESRESPKPDGTPPTPPSKAWLAAEGTLVQVSDSISKKVTLKMESLNFHDKEYKLKTPVEIKLDLLKAKILQDKISVAYSNLKEGSHVLVVSYDEKLKRLKPASTDNTEKVLQMLPELLPIDEVHLRPLPPKKEEEPKLTTQEEQDRLRWKIYGGISLFLLLALTWGLLPSITYAYLKKKAARASTVSERAYYINRLSEFLFNQLGRTRGELTPLEFASRVIDPEFNIGMTGFVSAYHKIKYAKEQPTEADLRAIDVYYPVFMKTVRSRYKGLSWLGHFVQSQRTIRFLL